PGGEVFLKRREVTQVQGAEGGIEVHLQAGAAGREAGGLGGLLAARAKVNAVIAAGAGGRGGLLGGERGLGGGGGRVVGHVKHTGDAAGEGRRRAGGPVRSLP